MKFIWTIAFVVMAGFYYLIGLPIWVIIMLLILSGICVFAFDLDDLQ